MTSGQLQRDVEHYVDECGGRIVSHAPAGLVETACPFIGYVSASFDPEYDPESVRWTCPECHLDQEDRV